MNRCKSAIFVLGGIILLSGCTWRTSVTPVVKVWPPGRELTEARPSLTVRFREFTQLSFTGGLDDKPFREPLTGKFGADYRRRVVLTKLVESGLFGTISSDPAVDSDLTVDIWFFNKSDLNFWNALAGALTILIVPMYQHNQEMVILKFSSHGVENGEATALEKEHNLVFLPFIPVLITQDFFYMNYYKESRTERLVEASLKDAMRDELFKIHPAAVAKKEAKISRKRVWPFFGRVYQIRGQRDIIVLSSISSRLKVGRRYRLFGNRRRPVSVVQIKNVYETRFSARKISGEDAQVGMLVGI